MVGALDDNFPPASAAGAAQLYKDRYSSLLLGSQRPKLSTPAPALEPVNIFVKEGKGHSMIGSEDEMRAIMEFLGGTLVQTMLAMEGAAGA